MVTIKKIEIKGFFGKGDFEWVLDPVVNILGGKNGSGKSTIFKFCYALLSADSIPDAYEKEIEKVFKEMILTFSNDWILKWNPEIEGDTLGLKMEDGRVMPFRRCYTIVDETGKERKHAELQDLIRVYLINSFEQHVAKVSQYEQQPKAQPLDDPTVLDLMIKDQIAIRNQKAIEELMDSQDVDDAKSSESKRVFNLIYSSLKQFLQDYDTPFKSSFEFTRDKQKFGYEHLSMGEKQILLLLLMVSNANQQPCIFFMDEPDLSMHIDWKENLISALHELNPNMQIILSTHAPSVITGWHDRVNEVSNLIK